MKYENEGLRLWFGTADAEAPSGQVPPGKQQSIIIGVSPPDASHRVRVRFRVDGGPLQEIDAQWMRSDATGKAQYFRAFFPALEPGNHVEYAVACDCDGKRVPALDAASPEAGKFQASFIVEKEATGPPTEPIWSEVATRLDRGTTAYLTGASRPEITRKTEDATLTAGENPLRFMATHPTASPGSGPAADGELYRVEGKVVSRSRAGVGELRVLVVDKNVGGDLALAQTITNNDGFYQTAFKAAYLLQRGKHQPDLQARVFSDNTFLAASDVCYRASQRETLNVLLPESVASSLKSEHEVLSSTLASEFHGRLSDLKENDKQQDITYLANKTGWDARAVALAALADQFSARTADAKGSAVPQSFFYALFRAGLPANEETLYHTDARALETVWKKAMEQGVIPQVSAEQISSVTGRFQALSAQKLLTAPALVGTSSLKEMLTTSRLSDTEQEMFAELYARNQADTTQFWKSITDAFGQEKSNRLQVDGKLAFLTFNNANLMQTVHATAGNNGIADTLELAQMGYHRPEAWQQLLTAEVSVPKEVPGDTPEIKRQNYANYLAAQVRLSYPTASVAQLVKSGELPLPGVAEGVPDQVHAFLTQHQGKFELGVRPVEQYIAQNKLQVADEVVRPLKQLQRVYQITPSDQALTGLIRSGIDSAYQVAHYDKDTFVRSFADSLGGADQAAITHDKSVQIHNAVLNVALSYLNARTAAPIGVHSSPGVIDPAPANAGDVIAYATLESLFGSLDFCACDHCRSILSPAAYLVDLLLFLPAEEREWAAICSIWRSDHAAPYPFPNEAAWTAAGRPTDTEVSPREIFLSRRPDVNHLPLTCENTNTALPYIDVVNETLEYYVANATVNAAHTPQRVPLFGFEGHDSNGIASEDLLASPQFVIDAAYTTLRADRFPMPLPFHQPLENLRRYFLKFDCPLPLVMERFRPSDDFERGANEYGWRDVLMEEIDLSRDEHEILTESSAVRLNAMYGFPAGTTDADVIEKISNAKRFARLLRVTYEEIVAILRTRFVNPNSALIPKLERLGVSFTSLHGLKNGTVTDAQFDALLRTGVLAPDPVEYDGDIKAWVKRDDNFDRLMGIITLTDPLGGSDPCSFDNVEFRYSRPLADGGDISTRINAVAFMRLLRFIRLWRKLGWTIEQTDTAICGLYRTDLTPIDATDIDTAVKLDAGFTNVLPRLGLIRRVMTTLNLTPKRDLLRLLACFSSIGTHDSAAWVVDKDRRTLQVVPSLYRQLFMSPAILAQDPVFADNGYGEFLKRAEVAYTHSQPTLEQPIIDAAHGSIGYNHASGRLSFAGILDAATRNALKMVSGVSGDFQHAVDELYREQRQSTHAEALRSAFNLTGDEYDLIVSSLSYDADTPLTIENISAVFRRGWLSRKLKLSVRELLLLAQLTGLDPFASPNPTNPAVLRLIELIQSMKDRSFKSAVALYLIWNQDLSGKSSPGANDVLVFARALRLALAAVETEFSLVDDPDGSVAQARFAMIYGAEAAAFFFGLLNDTLSVEVEFSDRDGTLSESVQNAIALAVGKTDAGIPRVAYDDFRKRLSYFGILTTLTRDAIKAAAGAGTTAFNTAVDNLYNSNQAAINPFFARYPELRSPYEVYVADTVHEATEKRSNLLNATLPDLVRRRKRQQALQSVSAIANIDITFTQTFLDPPPPPASFLLHATGHVDQPALNEFLAVESRGLSVQFFASNTATGANLPAPDIAAKLDYAPLVSGVGNPLPANPTPGNPISGIWRGYIEAPERGLFNFRIETDTTATVTLLLDGDPVALANDATILVNADPIELRAGTLYPIILTVENLREVMNVRWEWQPKGQGRDVIPARYLYPATAMEAFNEIYVRFMKVASLATGLGLTAEEMAWFGTHPDYRINALGQLDTAGDGWLNKLPNADNLHLTNPAEAAVARNLNAALALPLRDLLDFARIKSDISPEDEALLAILKDPSTATQKPDNLLFTTARWSPSSLTDVLARFGSNIAALSKFGLFRRVYDAFALIQKMGISASALLPAVTNNPTGDTVRNLQAALRARYDSASWRDVIQPINDVLRSLQRNALVAYILHQMGSHNESAHIDTPEKLFEYFLMDVQMEPCMQTSRIRHALSSVQLFIERCLMNLERRVSPAVFSASLRKQWEWMKRYRVWEANRKVYLFPENWLEPELRDDQSPFFKEAMSDLLQSDLTEERAATALLNYLSKLDEVAKLEPCGIHHIPANEVQRTGEIDHVIARTSGAHRKYFYRRFEGGYWTPWDEIKLGIEDDPVIPVVWNERLLLFWLRVLKQQSDAPPRPFSSTTGSDPELASLKASQINTTPPSVKVTGILCWSEYYNGKWQPIKTSDVALPGFVTTGAETGDYAVLRKDLGLSLASNDDVLHVSLDYFSGSCSSFKLYNTHGLPLRAEAWERPAIDYRSISQGSVMDPSGAVVEGAASPPLVIHYFSDGHGTPGGTHYDTNLTRNVILLPPFFRIVEPHQPWLPDPFEAPFFFEDSQHVFYVTSRRQYFLVLNNPDYGVTVKPGLTKVWTIPPLIVDLDPRLQVELKLPDVGPIGPDLGVGDPAPIRKFVAEDANIRRGIGTLGSVTFGDRQIGPAGEIPKIKDRI